jgi:hypothetical protein
MDADGRRLQRLTKAAGFGRLFQVSIMTPPRVRRRFQAAADFLIILIIFFYLFPAIIAEMRGHRQKGAIIALSMFLGAGSALWSGRSPIRVSRRSW